jgi:hypothetical protein
MNALRKGLLPLLLVGAMFTQSCKEDSTGPGTGGNNNAPVTATFAKAGSTYYYHLHHKDQSGATVTSDTNIYTISRDDLSIGGRTNVRLLELTTEGQDQGTIAYLSYNADSSASLFFAGTAIFGGVSSDPWINLPIRSSGNSHVVVADTTMDFLGVPMQMKIEISSTFLSSENLTVAGKTYAVRKFKLTNTTTTTTSGVPSVDSRDTFMWWIPEIGFFGKMEETLIDDRDREVLSTETLAHFTLVK